VRTVLILLLCALAEPASAADTRLQGPGSGRWYTAAEQQRGSALYAIHCAGCHGAHGEGQPGWDESEESRYHPAPPLDGTGHSAHHPIGQMLRILDTGGGPTGGWMPSFADVLSNRDKRAVIAWIQSLWSGDTYQQWLAINNDVEEK